MSHCDRRKQEGAGPKARSIPQTAGDREAKVVPGDNHGAVCGGL